MRQELSNLEAVVLAVLRLGGDIKPQDTEDIAVKADELAPGRFRWRKYPGFISDELIRVFLSDAKKPKNGGLVAGDGTKGWRLTVAGVKFAEGLMVPNSPPRLRTSKEFQRRRRIEKLRIEELPAWIKSHAGDEVTFREAEAVFRIGDYTTASRRAEMIDRLCVLFTDDPATSKFLASMNRIVTDRKMRND